jgi:hypothetical protein
MQIFFVTNSNESGSSTSEFLGSTESETLDSELYKLRIVSEKRLIVKVKRHANVSQETLASLSKQKPLKGRAPDIGMAILFFVG